MDINNILEECKFFDDLINNIPKEHYFINNEDNENGNNTNIPSYVPNKYVF